MCALKGNLEWIQLSPEMDETSGVVEIVFLKSGGGEGVVKYLPNLGVREESQEAGGKTEAKYLPSGSRGRLLETFVNSLLVSTEELSQWTTGRRHGGDSSDLGGELRPGGLFCSWDSEKWCC